MDKNDYLEDLGLDPHKKHTTTDIKKAWRKKCLEHHPDRGGEPSKFQETTHAYKMLTDSSYRHSEATRKEGPKGGLNINLTVPIAFEDAFFGREVLVTYNIVELDVESNPISGKEFEVVCAKVKVPPGGFSHSHRVKGKGLKKGKENGDAFINMQAMAHTKYSMDRSNSDVVSSENVPLDIMLRGGILDVMTMWGLRNMKVPPGSKEGDSIYIPKCGIREMGRHRVQLKSVYPTKEELKSNSTWKGLEIDWDTEEGGVDDPDAQQDRKFEQVFINLGGFPGGTGSGL